MILRLVAFNGDVYTEATFVEYDSVADEFIVADDGGAQTTLNQLIKDAQDWESSLE